MEYKAVKDFFHLNICAFAATTLFLGLSLVNAAIPFLQVEKLSTGVSVLIIAGYAAPYFLKWYSLRKIRFLHKNFKTGHIVALVLLIGTICTVFSPDRSSRMGLLEIWCSYLVLYGFADLACAQPYEDEQLAKKFKSAFLLSVLLPIAITVVIVLPLNFYFRSAVEQTLIWMRKILAPILLLLSELIDLYILSLMSRFLKRYDNAF